MREPARCGRCGEWLPQSDALGNACPRCLLEAGFDSSPGSTKSVATSAPATAGPPEEPGPLVVARYRILRLIGEGGMGAVYEAEQDLPRRNVALKIIKPGLATPALLRRFEQESQALGRLQHPGIAQIYEAGTADTGLGPQPYFAMEFIHGKTLTEYAHEHRLGTRQRLEMVAKVADATHHAHQRGLIHRDLKPGNILVDETGQPKILDFGIARVTDSDTQATIHTDVGRLVGTLAYMSPEQALADPLEIDTRSDVYALGVVLYELLAGRPPYIVSRNVAESIRAIREVEPVRLSTVNRSYRGDIETIVATALAKDRTLRYGSAADLSADIHRYLQDEAIVARPPSASYQLRKFARRNKALVAGVTAVFVSLAAVLAVIAWQLPRARRAETAALLAQARALAERDRANRNEQLARAERDRAALERERALGAQQRAREEAETATAQLFLNVWQSLARASVFESGSRVDDDRAALLARQALLFHARTPDGPGSLVEEALQRATQQTTWTRNLLPGHEIDVYAVAFSSDGTRLAAAGSDNIVRVWDLRNRTAAPVNLEGHEGPASSVAFSPDGSYLASGGGTDNSVRIWDLRKPTAPPRRFQFAPTALLPAQTPLGKVNAVAFSPDGEYLAAGGVETESGRGGWANSFTVRIWDLRKPEQQPVLLRQAPRTSGTSGVFSPSGSLTFSPDGNYLACGNGDSIVRVWDLRDPAAAPVRLDPEFAGSARYIVYAVAFSPDGDRLASASGDTFIRLWDLRTPGAPPVRLPAGGFARSVAFSHDGQRLVAGGSGMALPIWDLRSASAQPVMVLQGHRATVNAVAFSPDGMQLASGSSDKTVRVWDLRNDAALATRIWPASRFRPYTVFRRTSVAFSRDGERLAAGGPDNAVRLFDLRRPGTPPVVLQEAPPALIVKPQGRVPVGTPRLVPEGPEIMSVAFAPDGTHLATGGTDTFARVWDLRRPQARPALVHASDSFVDTLVFSSDSSRLVSGGGSGRVRVTDLRNPGTAPRLLKDTNSFVYAVALSPDDSYVAIATGAPRYSVQIWDLRTSRPPISLRGHTSFVQSVTYSPDGSRLASASSDGTARVWNLRDVSAPPLLLQNPGAVVYSVAFSPDGLRLALASGNGTGGGVRLFDLRNPTAAPVLIGNVPATSVAFSRDGTRLAAGGEDGSVHVWPLWRAAADSLCRRVSRNLSRDEWRQYVGEGIPYERTCPALPAGPRTTTVPLVRSSQ